MTAFLGASKQKNEIKKAGYGIFLPGFIVSANNYKNVKIYAIQALHHIKSYNVHSMQTYLGRLKFHS